MYEKLTSILLFNILWTDYSKCKKITKNQSESLVCNIYVINKPKKNVKLYMGHQQDSRSIWKLLSIISGSGNFTDCNWVSFYVCKFITCPF